MARVELERHTRFDGTPVTIRTADTGDAAVTLALFRSVLEEGRYAVQTPSEVTVTEKEEQGFIEAARIIPGRLCLVAEGGEAAVGTVRPEEEPYRCIRHFADVQALWVHASWRHRGVTGRLLATLIAWARAHPEIEKLGLYVFSTNEAAICLYQENGFVIEAGTP